jgi:nicotinamidase-related amidase
MLSHPFGTLTHVTTLPDRPNTALLIIDVQKDVVAGAHQRDEVIANIDAVLHRARQAGTPVIWVQHQDEDLPEGCDGWQYVDELQRDETEPLVHKRYGDSFEETDLEQLLAERKVGRVVVTGAQTDACIRSTLHGALVRGYDATLVADAHTTEDPSQWGAPLDAAQVIAHTNLYWSHQSAPGRRGGTVAAADVSFGVAGAG